MEDTSKLKLRALEALVVTRACRHATVEESARDLTFLELAEAVRQYRAEREQRVDPARQDFFDSCFASKIDRSVAERIWEELQRRRRKGPLARAAEGRPANFAALSPEEQWEIDKKLGILDWDGNQET